MYTFKGRVRYSETDSGERLTLAAITDYFQDCGTFQSEELGLGVKYLEKSHMAWVLSGWQIIVEEYPSLGDEITIGTFPYEFKRFIGYRNYTMDRSDGSRIAYANAIWVLTDTESMKPVLPTQEMYEKYALEERLDMEYAPRRIAGCAGGREEEAFFVKNYHIDSNHHVNNVQYIKMASQYLPEGSDVGQMRAEYKVQAHLGDEIFPIVTNSDNRYVISMCDSMKRPYAIVEFTLRSK